MNNHLLLQFFIALLLAHLLADFVLQPDGMVKQKDKWYWRALHSLIHALLAYILLAKWTLWYIPLIVGASHYLIDWGKNALKGYKALSVFVLDQAAHLAILIGLSFWLNVLSPSAPAWTNWLSPWLWDTALLLCALLLLLPMGGLLIGYFMDPFQKQIKGSGKGLKNGGKYIGYLERLLIMVFILTNQFAGVGFLVAAKSILRFSEVKNDNDRKETEYIIIGTFASFLYAIAISGLVVRGLVKP
jgi:Protein of unknown function (DUF3307).